MSSKPSSQASTAAAAPPRPPLVSVVIPLFLRRSDGEEKRKLRAFLPPLRAADVEVVICETGAEPRLREAAEELAARPDWQGRLRYFFDPATPPLSRAASMNLGVERARGRVVLLFHLDCIFPAEGLARLREAIGDGVEAGGFTKIYRDKPRLSLLHLTEYVLNERRAVRQRRLVGTNGIFLTRALAREHPLRGGFLEDVELSDWLRRRVSRERFRVLRAPVAVSIRKYSKLGVLRSVAVNAAVMLLYRLFRVRASLLQSELYHRRFPTGAAGFWGAWLRSSLWLIAQGGKARGI